MAELNLRSEPDIALSWHTEKPLLRFHAVQAFWEGLELEIQDQEHKVHTELHQCKISAWMFHCCQPGVFEPSYLPS